MPPSFAVIAEGPSDFEVLRHILAGFFSDPDIVVNQIQPAVDATTGKSSPGGWFEVLRFLGSDKFAGAFTRDNLVVVHIDTDVCEEPAFGVSRREPDGRERTCDELIAHAVDRLVNAIGPDLHARLQHRIVFAIAVESIECWLLPLYYRDNRRAKPVNCLRSLNEALSAKEGFSIDPEKKQVKYYTKAVRPYTKRKTLDECAPHNPSLARFFAALQRLQTGESGAPAPTVDPSAPPQ